MSVGLYNLLVPGGFERGQILLPILGFTSFDQIGRFRDTWIEKENDILSIRIFTRLGSENSYLDIISNLRNHNNYLKDEQDVVSYRSFWFSIPSDIDQEFLELLKQYAREKVDMKQLFDMYNL